MRIVICGDVHIGAVFGLGGPKKDGTNSRISDYEQTLDFIVNYCIEQKVDAFVQTGDLFESRNPTLEHMAIADKALKKLAKANISSFVIMGNHDYKRSGEIHTSAITSLSAGELPNVKILIDPKMIYLTNKLNESVNLLLVPYRDRKMYTGKYNKEQSLECEKLLKKMIADKKFANKTIAVGHNFFLEKSYQEYGGSEIMLSIEAFKGCDAVFMGHLHSWKDLKTTSPKAFYTGSMEKTNFGEAFVDKVIFDYNVTTETATVVKLPVRQLLDKTYELLDANFENAMEKVNEIISAADVKDRIVRFKFIIDEKYLPALDIKVITSKLYALGAHYVSKIFIETNAKRVVRDSSILKETDDFSMLKAFISSQELDSVFAEEITLAAKEIMGVK